MILRELFFAFNLLKSFQFKKKNLITATIRSKMTDMTDLKFDPSQSYAHIDIMTNMTEMTDKS